MSPRDFNGRKRGDGDKPKTKPGLKKRLLSWLPSAEQLSLLSKVLSRKERYLIFTFGLLAIIAFLSLPVSFYRHITKIAPDYGGSFVEGVAGTPKYINPLLAQTSDVDRDIASLIYKGLMKYNGDGDLEPALAESYAISEDGLTYTFNLKDNLTWHDEKPITANDVVFTILTAQNTDYGSFQRTSWQGVEVNKINEKTVSFKLKNKYAQFLGNTTLGILPKHIWENIKPAQFGLSEFNLKPAVGSGPYRFIKLKRDTQGNIKSMELESFDDYYEGRPYISKITFKFYASEGQLVEAHNNGEIDNLGSISAYELPVIRFAGQLNVNKLQLPRYFAIFFNQNKSEILSDLNIRRALNYATDKNAIIDSVLAGNGISVNSPMLNGIIPLPNLKTDYGFDLDKADQLLDDANWELNEENQIRQKLQPAAKKGEQPQEPIKFEIRLTTSNWPELASAAKIIQEQWAKIGVMVELETLPLPELQQVIKERDYEALLFGEVLGLDPDPFSFWHSSQKKDPGLNLALYDNKQADKILEETRQTLDRSERFSKYNDFQEVVVADAPAVFLFSPDYLYAKSVKIKNGQSHIISVPSDRFAEINKWYIETQRVRK